MSIEEQLQGEFSATVWAEAFSARFGVVRRGKDAGEEVDDDVMLGWFANAIMAGYDWRARKPTIEPVEWMRGIVEDTPCAISGCDYTDIDVRGPLFIVGDNTAYYLCVEHWEAIHMVLGRQVISADDGEHWSPDEPDT